MMNESGAGIFVPSSTPGLIRGEESPTRPQPQCDGTDVINRIPGLPRVAEAVSSVDMAQVTAKVDLIKKWTIGTFKNSKQQLLEHMGKIDKTVDSEFELECENIKDLHRRYGAVATAARQFTQILAQLSSAEKMLAESLYQLSLKENSLKTQCATTSDSMRKVGDHAASLETFLRYFLSSMDTLHSKTIADTIDTIYVTEAARIEFDVHRHELASLQGQTSALPTAIHEAQQKCESHREKYEQMKTDVRVKLRLLEENRVGVMSVQLEKLQKALSAYFTGNAQLLASAVEELAAISPQQYTSFLLQ